MALKPIEITTLEDPRISMFCKLTDPQLRQRQEPQKGIFIAESPKVIRVALRSHYDPLALLCERRHLDGDAADIIAACPDLPVYTGDRDLLSQITGYRLTRGVLCAMHRPTLPTWEETVREASRIAVIKGVVDTTNIGAIFRSAAALGMDAVLLTTDSCDPLNRRALRVSMGTVLQVPWTWINEPLSALRRKGFKLAAMALRSDVTSLDDPRLMTEPKLAIILGTEGDGLPRQVVDDADYVVCIPMSHGVDSLNVAAASAVAFWQLRKR